MATGADDRATPDGGNEGDYAARCQRVFRDEDGRIDWQFAEDRCGNPVVWENRATEDDLELAARIAAGNFVVRDADRLTENASRCIIETTDRPPIDQDNPIPFETELETAERNARDKYRLPLAVSWGVCIVLAAVTTTAGLVGTDVIRRAVRETRDYSETVVAETNRVLESPPLPTIDERLMAHTWLKDSVRRARDEALAAGDAGRASELDGTRTRLAQSFRAVRRAAHERTRKRRVARE